jgi:hypothetical protein
MAAVLNLTAPHCGTNDMITGCCAVALQSAISAVYQGPKGESVTGVIGGIVSAAGFPEFGIPIAVVGFLVSRWMAAGPPMRRLARN